MKATYRDTALADHYLLNGNCMKLHRNLGEGRVWGVGFMVHMHLQACQYVWIT